MDDSQFEYWHKAFTNMNREGFAKTSEETPEYNCIAWAAGVSDEWWSDHELSGEQYKWPGTRMRGHIKGLLKLFEGLGYMECGMDKSIEPGYSKVALYQDGDGLWTHAAKQLQDGRWTTKDGVNADITHAFPECVCPHYGRVHCFMKRKNT